MKAAQTKAFWAMLAMITVIACKKETATPVTPTTPPNEEELITTAILTLVDTTGGANDTITLSFNDPDGAGGADPVITSDTVRSGHDYLGSIQLLNASVDPAEDITQEVQDEAVDHQFFYQVSNADVTWSYRDSDPNGHPIGILTSWTAPAGPASTGTLTIILRHQPDKDAAGVSGGDITNAGGETDLEISVPVEIRP